MNFVLRFFITLTSLSADAVIVPFIETVTLSGCVPVSQVYKAVFFSQYILPLRKLPSAFLRSFLFCLGFDVVTGFLKVIHDFAPDIIGFFVFV